MRRVTAYTGGFPGFEKYEEKMLVYIAPVTCRLWYNTMAKEVL